MKIFNFYILEKMKKSVYNMDAFFVMQMLNKLSLQPLLSLIFFFFFFFFSKYLNVLQNYINASFICCYRFSKLWAFGDKYSQILISALLYYLLFSFRIKISKTGHWI